jgi:hypothetical protein
MEVIKMKNNNLETGSVFDLAEDDSPIKNEGEILRHDEEDLKVEKSSISLTLDLLKKICSRVDNPSVAVSLEDIVELCLEFGLYLQQVDVNLSPNFEVFEDPLNRGDALGNVKMISRKYHLEDLDLVHEIGTALLDATHSIYSLQRKEIQNQKGFEDLYLEEWDDVASEDILAAKQRIQSLRAENKRLDRRNERLYILKEKARKRRDRLVRRVQETLEAYKFTPLRGFYAIESIFAIPGHKIKSLESNGRIEDRTRNSIDERIEDSQTDCLKW